VNSAKPLSGNKQTKTVLRRKYRHCWFAVGFSAPKKITYVFKGTECSECIWSVCSRSAAGK